MEAPAGVPVEWLGTLSSGSSLQNQRQARSAPLPDTAGIPGECHRGNMPGACGSSAGGQPRVGEWRCKAPCWWRKSIRTAVASTLICRRQVISPDHLI